MDPSYNNSFGSFSSGGGQMTQPIMSPTSGDVVLPAQQGKKKKVGLIIGVILFLIAIGAGVAAVMLMGKGGPEYQKKYNGFANYLLYGESKNNNIDDFDPSGNYYIDEHYFDEQYLDNLIAKYNSFTDEVFNSGVEVFEESPFSVTSERLNFLKRINDTELINDATVFGIFKESGRDSAFTYVDGFYGKPDDYGDYDSNKYMNDVKKNDVIRLKNAVYSWDENTEITERSNSYFEIVKNASLYSIKSNALEYKHAMEIGDEEV